MRIKRLNTEWWMENEEARKECVLYSKSDYFPIDPIIGRPGVYKMAGESWFETKDGKAFTYPVKDFDWTFKTISASFLSKERVRALKMIIGAGLATPKQKELYGFACHAREIKNIYRRTVLHRMQVLGK